MGIKDHNNVKSQMTQKLKEKRQRTDALNSIYQTKFEKIILRLNLIIIMLHNKDYIIV